MNKRITYVMIIVLAISLSGCAMFDKRQDDAAAGSVSGLAGLSKTMRFEDVPVPAGYRLVDKDSFVFHNDQTRIGLLKYVGIVNAHKTMNFYKEQMPMYNWDLINIVEYGRKILNFERADQTCIITIEPHRINTEIIIAVAPKTTSAMTEERIQRYKEFRDRTTEAPEIKHLK